jgi:hypothetical protein
VSMWERYNEKKKLGKFIFLVILGADFGKV